MHNIAKSSATHAKIHRACEFYLRSAKRSVCYTCSSESGNYITPTTTPVRLRQICTLPTVLISRTNYHLAVWVGIWLWEQQSFQRIWWPIYWNILRGRYLSTTLTQSADKAVPRYAAKHAYVRVSNWVLHSGVLGCLSFSRHLLETVSAGRLNNTAKTKRMLIWPHAMLNLSSLRQFDLLVADVHGQGHPLGAEVCRGYLSLA